DGIRAFHVTGVQRCALPILGRLSRVVLVRVGEAALVVLGLATLVFLALRLLPGDPAALVLGDQASLADRALLRSKLHLDEPLWRSEERRSGEGVHYSVLSGV